MAFYRIEIGYRTKRGGVAVGMTVKAFGPEEAEEYAQERILGKYPSRKWAYTYICEATKSDICLGVFDAAAPPPPAPEKRGE